MKKILLSLLLCLSLRVVSNDEFIELVSDHDSTVVNVEKYLDEHSAVDVNYEHYDGQTALFCVYDVEVARLLLDRGAKIEHEDVYKRIALFNVGNIDVVQLLLDRGLKVDHEDEFKRTALFYVWNVEIARLLLDRGLKVDHEDKFKMTALFEADNVDVARLLLDRGAKVNLQDHHGVTPLFKAAQRNKVDVVRLLLDHGANIPFTVDQSESVVIWNNTEIIQMLSDKNILVGVEPIVDLSEIDGLISKQLKKCIFQRDATTCMMHALKNVQLLTKYYQADVAKREDIDSLFNSQSFYDECVQGEAFAGLKAIIEGEDFDNLYKNNGDKIGAEVFKISRAIDPKIQIVFNPKYFSLRQRDLSRKSEVVLVLYKYMHWHAVGLEKQEDGTVQVTVLDSYYSHFCLEKNFYRKLVTWFKGESAVQAPAEQQRSRL